MLAVGIGYRGAVGDLARTCPGVIHGRSVFPKNSAFVGIHRDGLAVGGGHEKHVMARALYDDAVEVNGRGIYDPVELDLAPA